MLGYIDSTKDIPKKQSPAKHNRIIAWLTGILTLLLATCSFVLSFNALTDLAAKHGVSIPPLFPFVVEFAVVIFSLNALFRSLSGEKATWQWLLIIGSSLLAGMFNVIHAESDLVSKAMAAMPSLFLLLSFESFLSLIKHSVTRQGVIISLAQLSQEQQKETQNLEQLSQQIKTVSQEIDTLRKERDTLQAEIATLQKSRLRLDLGSSSAIDTTFKPGDVEALNRANDTRQAQIIERREKVLSLLNSGMSQPAIADELGVSLATIKRDSAALNGKVRVIP